MGQPMMQQMGAPQVIVVKQAAVKVEPHQTCCGCFDIPCGATILLVFEIFYLIGFLITVFGLLTIGAVASASGSMGKINAGLSASYEKAST